MNAFSIQRYDPAGDPFKPAWHLIDVVATLEQVTVVIAIDVLNATDGDNEAVDAAKFTVNAADMQDTFATLNIWETPNGKYMVRKWEVSNG